MTEVISVQAPAKLTLELRVTGVRADGYHLIDAEMVTLDVADELVIDPMGDGVQFTGRFAHGIPQDGTDLVSRALRLADRRAAVTVHKHIPAGGGLGGGSADAAAVLRWAGYEDLEGASRLGADIPFCMIGGRARVSGIGEVIEPLPTKTLDITLIVPPLFVSTPAVYRAWDDLGEPRADGPNDLEPAALHVEPQLALWRDLIRDATGAAPVLAGSGATWFVLGAYPELETALPDAHVVVTRTRQ